MGTLIVGRVTAPSGEGLAEVQVSFAEAPADVPDIAALTDEDGRFSIYAPAPGTYVIQCFALGYEPGSVAVEIVDGEPGVAVEVRLAPG